MSFVHIGQLARGASRREAQRRRTAPQHEAHEIRGQGPVGRWWFTASSRSRISVVATLATASVVSGALVSQVVVPFWWTSASQGRLAAAAGAGVALQAVSPPTLDQQALWGLIAGPPGAIAAVTTSSTNPQPPVESAATSPSAAVPAVLVVVHKSTPRIHVVPAAAPAAVHPVVAPSATSLIAAKIKLRALEMSSQADSTIRTNLERSGVAKLLCTNDPTAVAKWSLESFCAALATDAGGLSIPSTPT